MMDVRSMLDVAERYEHEGDSYTPDDFDIDITDVDEAIELWRRAQSQARAAKVIVDVAGQVVAQLLGEGGAARIGPDVVRYKIGRTETCHDPDGFTSYVTQAVTEGEVKLEAVFNASYAKKSWMPQAVRETFFDWIEDDHASLTVMPIDRAPKFLQSLEDGDIFIKEPA